MDHLGFISTTLGDLQGSRAVVSELIQNADDAVGATRMSFTVTDDALEVWNDGVFQRCDDLGADLCPWLEPRGHRCDFHSFRAVAGGDKQGRTGTTGAFGVGFTAVYQLTDRPELLSNGQHWIIDETASERTRISSVPASADHVGTTFRLPWAYSQSDFRRRIRQDVVAPSTVAGFAEVLRDLVPPAMLFLNQIRAIEVCDGARVHAFERISTTDRITIAQPGHNQSEWHLLTGDFTERAEELKSSYSDIIDVDRSAEVALALPLSNEHDHGVLYATLPTHESTHLPVAVNAAFFPASDRKRILLDDSPTSEWNRAALGCAATVLADAVETLPGAIGDAALVRLIVDARELAGRSETTGVDDAYGEFWGALGRTLPEAAVVPTAQGGHGTPATVRLWAEPAEEAAAGLLHGLGIELVSSAHRKEWFTLRSNDLGLDVLRLRDVVAALLRRGLTSPWQPEAMAGLLGTEDGLATLWSLLNLLLTVPDRRSKDDRDSLCACAVAPGWDGQIWPIRGLHRADQESQDLFDDLEIDAGFLDQDLLSGAPALVDLVAPATPGMVIDWLKRDFDVGRGPADPDRRYALRWFHRRREALDREADDHRLAELPIFPTATGSAPLTDLVLPGEFADPLGLAQVVLLDGFDEGIRSFLVRLGARQLSFARYCIDHVPAAVRAGHLDDDRITGLVELLANGLPQIRDKDEVHAALQDLPLIPCTDGRRLSGAEVYLTADVRSVVGTHAAIADLPGHAGSAHRDLFSWLGAADEPRPPDIEARCRQLAAAPSGHSQSAAAILRHAATRFTRDPEPAKADFSRLKEISWLPAEGQRRGYRPEQVFSAFSRNLFASQGTFLDIPITDQRQMAQLLQWLGVRSDPEPNQVVEHLLWSAERGDPVAENLWQYLNTHAEDSALDLLQGQRCLLIADTQEYVRPSDVYWRTHPFGRHRDVLSPSFAGYKPLLDRLCVAEEPSPHDAIEVLRDVAANHGGERAPLLHEDVPVVEACWRLLSDGLTDGAVVPADLHSLRNDEVVLDGRGWLRRPVDVLLRDSRSLAKRFGGALSDTLVDRPEGQWRALQAAGVGYLTGAVTTHIVEQGVALNSEVLGTRLERRRRHVMRILDAACADATTSLARIGTAMALQPVSLLVIQQELAIANRRYSSEPYDRDALYRVDDGDEFLLHVVRNGEPDWAQIATELVRSLGVDASHAAPVAAAIRGVLAAATDDQASDELDEFGFAELDDAPSEQVEPRVASGFGGVPPTDPDGSAEGAVPADPAPQDVSPGELEDPAEQPLETSHASPTNADSPTGPTRSGGSGATRAVATRSQSRLRSYVTTGRHLSTTSTQRGDSNEEDDAVERAGVDAVMAYELRHGRVPTEMPPGHPGYDLRSEEPDGRVRFIEVKATADSWGQRGVALSSTQFYKARIEGDIFWLYVVDSAVTDPVVHAINDPASKVDQFVFDDGWHAVAEESDPPRPLLPTLRLPQSREGLTNPVPLVTISEGRDEVTGWLEYNDPTSGQDWFAVRVEGETLGLAHLGGIALVEPIDRLPEEDELVVVVLHDQDDPATGRRSTVRRWREEHALDGMVLAIRLWSDSSVEPLTVAHTSEITVRGTVRARLSVSDLADLGYLHGADQ